MINLFKKIFVCLLVLALGAEPLCVQNRALADEQTKRFKDIEIRVIRPKYFTKRGKFELGTQFNVITNQTFIYTFLVSGLATYHFTESLGIEFLGAYGFSVDKDDKSVLEEKEIYTLVLRTQYIAGGALLWTPIYGKFQTSSGRLIYFDTFLQFGAGMTGIEYLYDDCPTEEQTLNKATFVEPPAPQTIPYPTFYGGIGQRFFLDKSSSLRWDLRSMMFTYETFDGECRQKNLDGSVNEELKATSESKRQFNVTIQIGYSIFL